MKYFLLFSLLSITAMADDLRVSPLTKNEKRALRVAKELARELNEKVAESCVNASFAAGTNPVHVQFLRTDADGTSFCVDAHYSIRVNFSDDKIVSLEVLDG